MEQYSDIIALDLLYTWINRSVSSVEDGARNMVGVDQDQLDQWRVSIANTRQELAAKQSQVQQKVGAIEQMIARTQSVESVLAARMGTRIGDTIAFAASQTPN
jgi:phage terminase Nu1 subunit (DNA packaging protein)